MQKFRDVLSRWERRELSAMDAGEILGVSERQFRRYRQRYARCARRAAANLAFYLVLPHKAPELRGPSMGTSS